MGFGTASPYTNVAQVPYPPQTLITSPGSLRPANSIVLFDDLFNSPVQPPDPQMAWSQWIAGTQVFGLQTDITKLCSFIRISQLMAMEGSFGSLQIYAGTVAGSGSALVNWYCPAALPATDAVMMPKYRSPM